jgi:hypothetical protein
VKGKSGHGSLDIRNPRHPDGLAPTGRESGKIRLTSVAKRVLRGNNLD